MGFQDIEPIYEDLFVIGLSIFSIDKRISRSLFSDNWTRELNVNIPVLKNDIWNNSINNINTMLCFLTGDKWNISFRPTEESLFHSEKRYRKTYSVPQCDSVCLFSGGLDSFCGAITLLKEGKSPCLIGHNEYPKLRIRQENLAKMFREEYPDQNAEFISFTAGSRAPQYATGEVFLGSENTSRGRSLLFLCVALVMASVLGDNISVYIPENGFIGLNVPLTNNRKGSCSTRTTHPHFLNMFKELLENVGIKNQINNFFAYETKRNIVNSVKDEEAFKRGYLETISCSHPCIPRYNKNGPKEYPINCGYCYPCIIRKSSLLDVPNGNQGYTENALTKQFINKNSHKDIVNDLKAVISAIYRFKHIDEKELIRLIKGTGKLSNNEINKFKSVYNDSINDIIELLSKDKELKGYIGL
jgi:7-cyano-7-deazaguanine synthase in queuosine biosynthesis